MQRVLPGLMLCLVCLGGCKSSRRGDDYTSPRVDLAGQEADLGDVEPPLDAGPGWDLSGAWPDLAGTWPDLAGVRPDLATASADFSLPPSDLSAPRPDLSSGREPCSRGGGFVAFRFHYSSSSGTSPITDVYGLPDRSNWEVFPAYPTMLVDLANGGGINIGSSNWIIIRYSVVGMTSISSATLSIRGRSYSTGSSGSFIARTPLHGDTASATNSVSNAWPYTWTSIDFTGYVAVGDTPGLTGIRMYGGPSSSSIVVNTVELCITGT